MKPSLIVAGLGNPGASYTFTRHNVGFWAVEHLAEQYGEGEWKDKQKFASYILEGRIVTAPILFVKPQTYMNRSGEAIQKLLDFFRLDPNEQLLVICDDVDLPLGDVRLRKKGGPGTHNGLKSIVDVIGEEFPRLRIGLGSQPPDTDLANWVLSAPSKEEEQALRSAVETLPGQLEAFVLGEEPPR